MQKAFIISKMQKAFIISNRIITTKMYLSWFWRRLKLIDGAVVMFWICLPSIRSTSYLFRLWKHTGWLLQAYCI